MMTIIEAFVSSIDEKNMKWFKWVQFYLFLCAFSPSYVSSEIKAIARRSLRQDGDVILAGLLTVHHRTTDDHCGSIKLQGMAYLEAMIYAIEKINNDSKLLPNITLGYDVQDYCDNLVLASESAFAITTRNLLFEHLNSSNRSKLAEEIFGEHLKPVAAVIGTADSSSSMVVASMLQVRQIPQVSPFATSEELTSNDYKTFFRTVPSDRQQAKAIADIIDYFGWTYVTIIGVDSSYGRWGVLSIEREAQKRKTFCIHVSEMFPTTRYESKVTSIISRLKKETRSKVVVLWADPTTSLYVLEAARLRRVHGMTWLAPDGWSEAHSLFRQEYMPVIGGFLGTLFQQFDISNYKKYMLSLTRESRNCTWWLEVWGKMDEKCYENGTTSSNACVNGKYSKVTEQMYHEMYTAYIPYVIDAVYAVAHALDGVYRCKNGSGPLAEGGCPKFKPYVHAEDLLSFLSSVSFHGITGEINFDANGNSEQTAAYSIVNLQPNTSSVAGNPGVQAVGSWAKRDDPRLRVQNETIYWNNGTRSVPESVCSKVCPAGTRQSETVNCCWECHGCPSGTYNNLPGSPNCTECPSDRKPSTDHTVCVDLPILNLNISDREVIAIIALSCLGTALLLFVLVLFVRLRHTALVKAANWELSCVLLFGISLGCVTSALYVMLPTTPICCLSEAGNKMYFVVCVSVLFLKTNRLIHIFKMKVFSSSLTKWIYSGKNQLLILILLNLVPILALAVWFVFDTPKVYKHIDFLKSIHYNCEVYSGKVGFAMHVVIFVYSIALAILCTFYAFKARKLPSNFNEAQYIGLAMYVQLLCNVTLFGIYNNLPGNQATLFYGYVILVSTFGFLFCIFGPKVYVIFRHPERNTAEYVKSAVSNHNLMKQMQIHHGKVSVGLNQKLTHRTESTVTDAPNYSEENEIRSMRNGNGNVNKFDAVKDENLKDLNEEAKPKGRKVKGAEENDRKSAGVRINDCSSSNATQSGQTIVYRNGNLKYRNDSVSKISSDTTLTEDDVDLVIERT